MSYLPGGTVYNKNCVTVAADLLDSMVVYISDSMNISLSDILPANFDLLNTTERSSTWRRGLTPNPSLWKRGEQDWL